MELGQRAAEPLDDAAKDDAFARLKRHALDGDVAFVASAPPRQNYARSLEKGKKKDVARVDEEELKKEDAFLEANAMRSDNKKLRCVRSPPPRPVHLPPPRDPARPPGENNNARARSQIPPRDEPNEPNERTNERTRPSLPNPPCSPASPPPNPPPRAPQFARRGGDPPLRPRRRPPARPRRRARPRGRTAVERVAHRRAAPRARTRRRGEAQRGRGQTHRERPQSRGEGSDGTGDQRRELHRGSALGVRAREQDAVVRRGEEKIGKKGRQHARPRPRRVRGKDAGRVGSGGGTRAARPATFRGGRFARGGRKSPLRRGVRARVLSAGARDRGAGGGGVRARTRRASPAPTSRETSTST